MSKRKIKEKLGHVVHSPRSRRRKGEGIGKKGGELWRECKAPFPFPFRAFLPLPLPHPLLCLPCRLVRLQIHVCRLQWVTNFL